MKHLFLVRHGEYDDEKDKRLNDEGKRQIKILSEAIENILESSSAYIVSSSAQRAIDSAEILAVRLGIPGKIEKAPYLWAGASGPSGNFSYDDTWDGVIRFIEERQAIADGLILISHCELFRDGYVYHFIHKKLGDKSGPMGIGKGKAVHIDLEGKTYQIIPPNRKA